MKKESEARAKLDAATAAAAEAKRRDAEILRQRLIVKFNRRSNPDGSELGTLVSLHAFRRAQLTGARDVAEKAQEDLRRNLAFFQQLLWEDKLASAVTRIGGATAQSPVVIAGTAFSFRAWDVSSTAPTPLNLPQVAPPITAPVAISTGGRFVAWMSRDAMSPTSSYTLSLWDSRSRKTRTETSASFRTVRTVIPAATGATVFLGGDDGIERWSFETRESIKLVDRKADRAVLSADDSVLATVGDTGLRVWALAPFRAIAGTEIQAVPGGLVTPATPVTSIAVSPKGKYLAAATANVLWVWDLAPDDRPPGFARLNVRYPLDSAAQRIIDLPFSPDEKLIAASSNSGRIVMLPTERGPTSPVARPRASFSLPVSADHIVFSADGQLFAAAGRDSSVRI
jgi:WD40 repeat protein